MRLFFDARMFYNSGIGRYSRNLCSYLLKGAFRLKVLLAGDIGEIKRFARENKIVIDDVVSYTSPIYSLSEQIEGSWLAFKYKRSVSLFHYPHFNIPWFIPDKGIVTIHDLIHLHFPEYFGRLRAKMARQLFIRVCKKARRIITVSESTRRDLLHLAPDASDKIRVIHNGVSELFKPISREHLHTFLQEKGLGRYILYVGSGRPHKNATRVLSVFEIVKDRFPDLKLVLIGEKMGESEEIKKVTMGLGNRVVLLEGVSDDELLLYYNGAEVFIFPSLYEGFGFSPLEAMACGTPVITSDTSSLPEVVGDAGIMVNPADNKEITDALIGLLQNSDLRGMLSERGLKRASLFTWERCSTETYRIYREAAGI